MPVLDNSQAGLIDQPIDESEVPEQTPEEGSASEEQQPEQQTFTRAEVEAMLSDLEKKVDSRIQSQVAKSENRTDKRIQDRLSALEINRSALKLSDEDYAAAQDAIINDELKNAYKQPQGPKGTESQQQPQDAGDAAQFVSGQIEAVFRREGVRVTPDMPEFKDIEAAWNDPNGSLADTLLAAAQAARAVASRTKSFKETAKVRTTNGGGGNSSTQTKPKTAEEKISAGLKKTEWSSSTPQT